ncbi:MAG: hypothetical protein AB4040_04955 [Synechococcus sp.]
MHTQQLSNPLEKRMNFFAQFASIIFLIFGVAAIGVQIAKFFLEGGWNNSLGIATALGCVMVYLGRKKFWKRIVNYCVFKGRKRAKIIAFLSPFLFAFLMAAIRASIDKRAWSGMNTEGGFIEYGTGLAYILATIFAIPVAKYFLKRNQKLLGFYYYIVAAAAAFICLEELSWGQRFVPIGSPKFFQEYNSKSELSLHNLVWVEKYLYIGFLAIGLLGATSWLLGQALKPSQGRLSLYVSYLVPSWYLSPFFGLIFIYAFIAMFLGEWGARITTFVEPIELLLSLGFLGFTIANYFRQPFDFKEAVIS